MVNNKGGKKYKRSKNFGGNDNQQLLLPDGDQQIYAKVLKKLGDCRFEIKCFDGLNRIGKVRGKLRKKVWIDVGDYVLVSTRNLKNEFTADSGLKTESNKADIFHKYTIDEVRILKKEPAYNFNEPKEINDGPKLTELVIDVDSEGDSDDCAFDFEDI
jgi:translation initiation factor 1A